MKSNNLKKQTKAALIELIEKLLLSLREGEFFTCCTVCHSKNIEPYLDDENNLMWRCLHCEIENLAHY